jgi:tetratricopeptide (TPR) repeat protein
MSRTGSWVLGIILVAATLFAYQSVWHAGFIWDDDVYVTNNPLLTASDGLRRIWFSFDSPSQYFPLTYTSFYLERALWGFRAAGFHWVNIILHAVNALLLWRLLARLRLPGAWLAAAIFALHPVQVESVAWITERKNVLMGLFFLLTLRAWVEFIDTKNLRRWRFYVAALILYVLALAAKTTACTLPVALILILWLKRIPTNWQRLGQIAPFAALAAGMGVLTIWWERYHQGTRGAFFVIGPLERLLIATRAIWFYLGKLLWPANLTFSYPCWTISASDPSAYLWLLPTAAVIAAIWMTRRTIGKSIALAALFFVATLGPVLGFIMLYTFRYTFVADHYQYLASIGPAALAGAGVAKSAELFQKQRRFIFYGVGILLLALGLLTWRQGRIYHDDETLWGNTLSKNPDSWLACNNLGNDLLQQGDTGLALQQFNHALELEPNLAENHNNLANAFSQKGDIGHAIDEYKQAEALDPTMAEVHFNLANAYRQTGGLEIAIEEYRKAVELKPDYAEAHSNLGYALFQLRDLSGAVAEWQKAVELEPDNPGALNNLAWVLATAPLDQLRDGAKALAFAQRADQLSPSNLIILRTLAAAYAETGKFAEAIKTAQSALALANAQGNTHLATSLLAQIALHEQHLPFRDSSQTKQ